MNPSDPNIPGEELPDYPAGPDSQVKQSESRSWIFRRWKRVLIITVLVVSAPFLYRGVKSWRAERLLVASEKARAYGDDQSSLLRLKQALALAPGNVRIQRAVELYNARSGDRASVEKIRSRMISGQSERAELLGLAEILASMKDISGAEAALSRLPARSDRTEWLRAAMIRAALASQSGSAADGAALCLKEAGETGVDKIDAAQLRTRAALYLLSTRDPASLRKAMELLLSVSEERNTASTAAWRTAAKIARLSDAIPSRAASMEDIAKLSAIYPKLRDTQPPDELLDADLKLLINPSMREALVKGLSESRIRASRSEQLDYARWLNGHGLSEEVIRFAGTDRLKGDTDWLLIVLDARSARKEWAKVEELLNSPAGSGLPESVRHLYLARAAMMQDKGAVAEREWSEVASALHLEKPETLAYIAGYEEQIGLPDQAERTFREMALRKETRIKGLLGIIRCQRANAPASQLIPMYEELLAESPGFKDAEGDLAYLRLLCWYDVSGSATTAETLLTAQPDSLARISAAALARMRSGNPKGALELYEGKSVDWSRSPLPWRSVRIAVLRANGMTADADALASTVDPSRLRPEERSLMAPATTSRKR
jgi:hypothetical protein